MVRNEFNKNNKKVIIMNKKRLIFLFCLNVFIISFLIWNPASHNRNIIALQNDEDLQDSLNSIEKSSWEWEKIDVLSNFSTSISEDPSITIDSEDNIHIVWEEWTDYLGSGSDGDIFYKRWNASTKTWMGSEVVSTESTQPSEYPVIEVDYAGYIHVAWLDDTNYAGSGADKDVFYKSWNPITKTWNTTEVVSTESTSSSNYVSIDTDFLGNVHLAWNDNTPYDGSGTDYDIFYKRWNASTYTWTNTEVVSTESTANSFDASIKVDFAGNIHIAWWDYTNYAGCGTDTDVFYKRWNVSSVSWMTTEVVSTESSGNSYYPVIDVDSQGNVFTVWSDYTDYAGSGGFADIFFKKWDAILNSWLITEVVSTESTYDIYRPKLIVDSAENIHITWYDLTNYAGSGDDADVFYKRWDNSLVTWTITEIISTISTEGSIAPEIAVDSLGNVHIAWFDYTDYESCGIDRDIFYTHSSISLVAPELAFIVPNPSTSGTINLNWNSVYGSTIYYIYKSSDYIWSLEGLSPIDTTSSSDYTDSISSNGFYYYSIVAESFGVNTTNSNCQYVEVKIPSLAPPVLAFITPNPTDTSSVFLDWNDIDGAVLYTLYRSTSFIWSIEGLSPIYSDVTSEFLDTLPAEGIYYYVVVASDGISNSTSMCQYVVYELPHVSEFVVYLSLAFGLLTIFVTISILRKKKKL